MIEFKVEPSGGLPCIVLYQDGNHVWSGPVMETDARAQQILTALNHAKWLGGDDAEHGGRRKFYGFAFHRESQTHGIIHDGNAFVETGLTRTQAVQLAQHFQDSYSEGWMKGKGYIYV